MLTRSIQSVKVGPCQTLPVRDDLGPGFHRSYTGDPIRTDRDGPYGRLLRTGRHLAVTGVPKLPQSRTTTELSSDLMKWFSTPEDAEVTI